MPEEMSERRKYCFEMIKHPLNRSFFEMIAHCLTKDGVYGWPDAGETFTRQEIVEALEEAKRDEGAASSPERTGGE